MTNTCPYCKRTLRYTNVCHNCGAQLLDDDIVLIDGRPGLDMVAIQGECAAAHVMNVAVPTPAPETPAEELSEKMILEIAKAASAYAVTLYRLATTPKKRA